MNISDGNRLENMVFVLRVVIAAANMINNIGKLKITTMLLSAIAQVRNIRKHVIDTIEQMNIVSESALGIAVNMIAQDTAKPAVIFSVYKVINDDIGQTEISVLPTAKGGM